MPSTQIVSFDKPLEDMYQQCRRPGGSLKETEIVLGDPIYDRRVKMPKWNIPVTMLQEPKVALKYGPSWGIPSSKSAHRQRAQYFTDLHREADKTYNDLVQFACEEYGDHGPLISSIIHDHFPIDIKNRLRFLARSRSAIKDAARLHEYLSTTRSPFFR